jgi:hypothetical protein
MEWVLNVIQKHQFQDKTHDNATHALECKLCGGQGVVGKGISPCW